MAQAAAVYQGLRPGANLCIIIIRGHLVALFVADMTPFTGWAEHLGGLACMQSVPLEWEDS